MKWSHPILHPSQNFTLGQDENDRTRHEKPKVEDKCDDHLQELCREEPL